MIEPPSSVQNLMDQLANIARAVALEEMASGVAHELNQPLGAIATYSQAAERMLARPQPMLDETRDVLRHIGDEAIKASEGIRRIRNVFTPDSAAKTFCNMLDIVNELKPALDLLASRGGLTFTIRAMPDLPKLLVERRRIQHVLFSLVQNAVEASAAQASQPIVLLEITADRYQVETSVSDFAGGVPAAQQPQLFRPFFTTKNGGSGLGLACSRSIVESYAGSIGYANGVDGGARFWFRLPAAP